MAIAGRKIVSQVGSQSTRRGPQVVTLHGLRDAVVVRCRRTSIASFRDHAATSLVSQVPLVGAELDLVRSRDTGRRIELSYQTRYRKRDFRTGQSGAGRARHQMAGSVPTKLLAEGVLSIGETERYNQIA
jgi:hypothetical protein